MKNYVKEYKGYKVPKGATHYGNSHPVAYFYKFNAVKIPFFYLNHEWKRSSACDVYIKDNLTELPEAPQEWMPVSGKRCNHMYDNGRTMEALEEVFIVGIDKNDLHVYQKDNSDHYYSDNQAEFLPLKTQQDKDREAFVERVKQLLPKSDTDDLILSGKLFDLGFTAPKASDNE